LKKTKIINDPVGGFVRISDGLILDIIDHPYFQRLRRIRQLGLTHLVYPGAHHTRFHHALGCYQLMNETTENLVNKEIEISEDEIRGVQLAILLHDIGHGPFSHALEKSIAPALSHESISLKFMDSLNSTFDHQLDLAISIFKNEYSKVFLNQLISSQLDIDRLDYLRRDSFYTGVTEGNIGSDRIIRMMNVRDNELVIEQKGIYSIENFLVARRLMYWQVYLHKTVVSAEQLMVKILERAKEISKQGVNLFASPSLQFFLQNEITSDDFNNKEVLDHFASLDDSDIILGSKVWSAHPDKVLALLCKCLVERKLFKTEFNDKPYSEAKLQELRNRMSLKYDIPIEDCKYFVFSDSVQNALYDSTGTKINILLNNDSVVDISSAQSGFNVSIIIEPVQRYFVCYPKNIIEN
jgi:uncharacterized protein